MCPIDWFSFAQIIPSGAKRQILSESLIVLGEIGGNDYNFWFAARRPREQANQFIPDIVATIGSAAKVCPLLLGLRLDRRRRRRTNLDQIECMRICFSSHF